MTKHTILGHTNPDVDSIVSGVLLEKLLKTWGIDCEYVIPDQEIDKGTANICLKYGLDPYKYQKQIDKDSKLILVDHNTTDLDKEVVGIVDHHPTFETDTCEYYINEYKTAAALIIAQNNEQYFTKEDLKLAAIAASVDSMGFNSTKTLEKDVEWIKKICEENELNYEEIVTDGIAITNLDDLKKASLNALKEYRINDHRVQASYIRVIDQEETIDKVGTIINTLRDYTIDNGLDKFSFFVYDMDTKTTSRYDIKPDTIEYKFYDKLESRNKVLKPDLEKEFKEVPKTYKKTSTY